MIEEWRGGLGAGSRLRDQQIPVLYYQSKYAERLPIGKPEILKAFTPERLRPSTRSGIGPIAWRWSWSAISIRRRWKRWSGRSSARIAKPAAAAPERNYPVPLPAERAGQGGDRSRSDTVVDLAHAASARASRRTASRDYRRSLVASARVPDDQRAVRRAVAQAGRAVPERRRLRRRADANGLDRSLGAERAGRQDRGGPGGAGDRGQARRASTASAPASSSARKKWTLAGYDRAYTERDKTESGSYVAGVHQPFPRGRAEPGHRLRASAGAEADPGDHRGRRQRRGQGDLSRHQPRGPRGLAAEGRT